MDSGFVVIGSEDLKVISAEEDLSYLHKSVLSDTNFLVSSRANEYYLNGLGYKLEIVVHIPIINETMTEELIIKEIAVKSLQTFNKYGDLFAESLQLGLNPRFIFLNSCIQEDEFLFFPQYQIIKEQINLFISYLSIMDINKGIVINQLEVCGFGESDYYDYSNKGKDINLENCKEFTKALDELLESNSITGLTISVINLNSEESVV